MKTTSLRTLLGILILGATTVYGITPPLLADRAELVAYGPYKRFTLEIDNALPESGKLRIFLGYQDNKFIQTWGEVEGNDRKIDRIETPSLTVDGNSFGGRLVCGPIQIDDKDFRNGVLLDVEIDAEISNGAITGTFTGSWKKLDGDLVEAPDTNAYVVLPEHLQWKTTEEQSVNGGLSGRLQEENELRENESFRKEYDWPHWAGQGAFNAKPSGYDLLDDLSKKRLVWKSASIPPARNNSTRHKKIKRFIERNGPTGGGSSPVVSNGLVYLYYWAPCGDSLMWDVITGYEELMTQRAEEGENTSLSVVEFHRYRADDHVICLDAETGQTVWKMTFKEAGYNRLSAKGSFTSNLIVDDGKVFGWTSGEKSFCLDAQTGELQWESTLAGGSYRMVAEDAIVGSQGGDLVAVDIATGEERWRVDGYGAQRTSPTRWLHQDKEYLISGNDGTVGCFDPQNGDMLWSAAAQGFLMCTGDYLTSVSGEVYKLSLDGAEQIGSIGAVRDTKLPAISEEYIYLKVPDTYSEKLKVFSITERDFIAEIGGTAEMYSSIFGKHGFCYTMDDLVMTELDATHTNSEGSTFSAVNIIGDEEYQSAYHWRVPVYGTTSYHPELMTHAFADGRAFIRSAFGIHCYDFRKETSTNIPIHKDPSKQARPSNITVTRTGRNLIVGGLPRASRATLVNSMGRSIVTSVEQGGHITMSTKSVCPGHYLLVVEAGDRKITRNLALLY